MAKINFLTAYPTATPVASSIVIGSIASGGATNNFLMSDIAAYVMSAPVSTITLQQVCDQGAVTTTGITVAGTTTLNGVLDANSTADISDTLTLSKASGTGLSLPSSSISVGGSTIISSTAVVADGFQTSTASFTATSSAVQCSFLAQFSAYNTTIGGTLRLTGSVPSSSTDTGSAGQIAVDATHIYVCVGANSWGRVAIDTTPF